MKVAPARERGLKCSFRRTGYTKYCRSREGAWIEIVNGASALASQYNVAPARERGLKLTLSMIITRTSWSLPRGSVD